MQIFLYRYGPELGLADLSPFCIKLESFLKLAGLPFEYRFGNPQIAPKGKLPFIELNGQKIADSQIIIRTLKEQHNIDLDTHLTKVQKATTTAFRSMLDEHLYFMIAYFRWQDKAGWKVYGPAVKNVLSASGVPTLLTGILLQIARRKALKQFAQQGTGKHSSEEITLAGKEILDALATLLQEGPYAFGDKPGSLDASIYAMLTSILTPPIESPLKQHALTLPPLTQYLEHFKKTHD